MKNRAGILCDWTNAGPITVCETTSICLWLIMTIGLRLGIPLVLKQILISLHFVSFNWNLSEAAREAKISTAVWMLLTWPFSTVSESICQFVHFTLLLEIIHLTFNPLYDGFYTKAVRHLLVTYKCTKYFNPNKFSFLTACRVSDKKWRFLLTITKCIPVKMKDFFFTPRSMVAVV